MQNVICAYKIYRPNKNIYKSAEECFPLTRVKTITKSGALTKSRLNYNILHYNKQNLQSYDKKYCND